MEYGVVTMAWLESLTIVCNLPNEAGEACLGVLAKFYGSDWDPLPTQSAWQCSECNQYQCGRELMTSQDREISRRSEREMSCHMESECAVPTNVDPNDQGKTLVEGHLRRQLAAYNAEDGIIKLPAAETAHAIKTLLFLVEAAKRENTAGGLQLETDGLELAAGDDAQLEQQAVGAMEVDEPTTGEVHHPCVEDGRPGEDVQLDDQSNAGGGGSSEGLDDKLVRTAAREDRVEDVNPLPAPLPTTLPMAEPACADIHQPY
jgi:hypothetical protein